jgi:hypothetical protein
MSIQELGNILSNNLAQNCLLVTTKMLGKPLKPWICGLQIENQ